MSLHTGRKIWLAWTWLTDGFLCLLLTAMILIACLQITLRTFFSGGLLWIDPLLRYMVIWSGLLGAVVATREGKHIAIDFITYLVPPHTRKWFRIILHLFSLLVAAILTWAAITFIRNEAQFGTSTLLDIPSWAWNLIFPLAFGLIAFHFGVALAADIAALFGKSINQATRSELKADGQ